MGKKRAPAKFCHYGSASDAASYANRRFLRRAVFTWPSLLTSPMFRQAVVGGILRWFPPKTDSRCESERAGAFGCSVFFATFTCQSCDP